MNKQISIKIDDVEYVRSDLATTKADTFEGLKYIICLTYLARVFAGYLESREGQEVVMRKARGRGREREKKNG